MTTPKLTELSPEQRRVLCAEKLGIKPDGLGFWTSPATGGQIPWIPDESHDDAFRLVEWMREKGFIIRLDNGLDGTWECIFSRRLNADEQYRGVSRREYYAPGDTAPKAIVSAFLLATGAATE